MYTWIRLNLSDESEAKLREFIEENRELISKPKKRLHSTVHYSNENPVFHRPEILETIKSSLPIKISPISLEGYHFDIFGKTYLVLRYKSFEVIRLKGEIINEALRQMICEWPCDEQHGDLNNEERGILRKSLAERDGRVYFDINPHITLSRYFNESGLEKLTNFGEEIVFNTFSWTQEK